jgi:membrane-bound ClpP family serine protease
VISSLHVWLSQLSPNAAVVLLTLGLFLIYYELNRPGSILPGALGLLATLLSIASLAPHGFDLPGTTLVLSAVALLTVDLLRPTSILIATAATVALIFGLRNLISYNCCVHISMPVALGCGFLLGAGTSVLTRLARRARVNKGLD